MDAKPKCRECNIDASDIKLFQERARQHNEDETKSLYIYPSTLAFGPGSYYDPSNNTFLCPKCSKKRWDEGVDLYATN